MLHKIALGGDETAAAAAAAAATSSSSSSAAALSLTSNFNASENELNVTPEMLEKLQLQGGSTTSLVSNATTIGGESSISTAPSQTSSTGDRSSNTIKSAISSVFGDSGSNSESRPGSGSRTSAPSGQGQGHIKGLKASILQHMGSHHDDNNHDEPADGNGEGGHGIFKHDSKEKHHHKSGHSLKEKKKEDENSDTYRLARWLQKGNVIYKSVGLGLMDLTVGMHLVRYAQERGVGTVVEGF